MTILSNPARIGSFTSSEIYKLLSVGSREMTDAEKAAHKKLYPKSQKKTIKDGLGDAALTHIEERRMAKRLGRALTNESNGKETTWGKCLEPFAFQKLGFDYDLVSDVTIQHPDIPYWCGSPDLIGDATAAGGGKIVGDIKCPMTLKSFCLLVDPIYNGLTGDEAIQIIREKHPDGEKYYQQLVSNSIQTNSAYAELIVYVPFRSDLDEIRLSAADKKEYRWIEYADDYELPWLVDGGYYQDVNIIHFAVPQSDKELLTNAVIEAGKLLQL